MATRKHRTFTAEFKTETVLALLSGQKSQAQLCREHEISPSLLQGWKETFLANAKNAFASTKQQNTDSGRIAELERALGQATLENQILKKASSLLSHKRGNLS
jgi:transposase